MKEKDNRTVWNSGILYELKAIKLIKRSIIFLIQKAMLNRVGGNTTREGIYLMMPKIMTVRCAFYFNITGKSSTKADFREYKLHNIVLGKLYNIIFGSMLWENSKMTYEFGDLN